MDPTMTTTSSSVESLASVSQSAEIEMEAETLLFYLNNPSTQTMYIVAALIFTVFYVTTMKFLFGTIRPRVAIREYNANCAVRTRYNELFQSRENMLYHISWAKSRGEGDQARTMLKDLKKLDEAIDEFEQTNPQLFGDRTKAIGEKNL